MTFCFINTRPTDKASFLSKALQNANIEVLELPLLAIHALELTPIQKKYLATIASYDLVVCVSPTAATMALPHLSESNTSIWVAVGRTTKQVLLQKKLTVQLPAVASNEGMLAMDVIKKLSKDNKVLILRGRGGRRLLYDDLVARSVRVNTIEFYERSKPQSLASDYAKLFKEKKLVHKIMLISSGEAWQHWLQAVQKNQQDNIKNYNYLVLGERLSSKAKQANVSFKTIQSLDSKEIIATMATFQ